MIKCLQLLLNASSDEVVLSLNASDVSANFATDHRRSEFQKRIDAAYINPQWPSTISARREVQFESDDAAES